MLRDVRFALRTLGKSPFFLVVAVLSLALGIGANTAIFTLTDQLLLRLLPVRDPEQLVQIRITGGRLGNNNGDGIRTLSWPLYRDLRDRNEVFSGLMARYPTAATMQSGGMTALIVAELVSGNYFEMLGVRPAAGRLLTAEDDRNPGGHPLVVLSYRYWMERFNGDPAIVGSKISLNGYPFTVIGVSEAGFEGIDVGSSPAIRVPITMKKQLTPVWDDLENRRSSWLHAFGRLKPGLAREKAEAGMRVLYRQIQQEELAQPEAAKYTPFAREKFLKQQFDLVPADRGQSYLRERVEEPLRVLTMTVAFVLLIACANLAGLLLARAVTRRREIALRFALGASRGQVVRQLFVESLLLSLAGAVLGLLVSVATCRFLLSHLPASVAAVPLSPAPDLRVFGFTTLVAFLAAVLFGLLPALRATRSAHVDALKDNAGSLAGAAGHLLMRKILVGSQVALALLLLAGAVLFARSLNSLRNVRAGFRPDHTMTFTLDPSLNAYTPARRAQLFVQLQQQIRALPGVQAVSLSSHRLLTGGRWDSSVTVEGYQARPGENVSPYMMAVAPDYFRTLGIPLLAGRDFRLEDAGDNGKVAVVNESFVKYFFGGGNAIGKRFGRGIGSGVQYDTEIVGVVADSKYTSLREENQRHVYHPFLRYPQQIGRMTFYVRREQPPDVLLSAIRAEIRTMDPNLPLFEVRTLDDQVNLSISNERLLASLSIGFSALAAFLAALGLYGVLAYIVTGRTREIGLRMAVGAGRGDILRLVLREVLPVTIVGLAAGLGAAAALGRLVASQLYGFKNADPVTLAAAGCAMLLVASLSAALPALRAARVQPISALRYE